MSFLARLIKEPLLHFLAAGLALFVAYEAFTAGDPSDEDTRIIVVDRAAIREFFQFRTRVFESELADEALDQMSNEARAALIEEYVREEALFRDGLALGLDEGDNIIRQRLVQKVKFLAEGFIELGLTVDEEAAREYFEDNREAYSAAPSITFTHVFFDAQARGAAEARQAAELELERLNNEGVTFSQAGGYGDRFPYFRNYVERGPQFVIGHFGTAMSEQLYDLMPMDEEWRGPLESPFGWHLVMLTRNERARDLAYEEVRTRVMEDLRLSELRRLTEEAIEEIIASYEVVVTVEDEVEALGAPE